MKKGKKYKMPAEIVLGDVPKMDVPEIKIRYNRSSRKKFLGKITSSTDVAQFIRKTFQRGEVQLQEQFIVLYLNQANEIIGYYKHSKGAINATIADGRIVLGVALKASAVSIIISHNHPSGNINPSEADLQLTKKMKEAAKYMDINILDHVIVTKDNYYSFADQGLLGLDNNGLAENLKEFLSYMEKDLRIGFKHNKRSVEALAYSLKITDRTEIKELTELAIANIAREIALGNASTYEKYERIVKLYNDQMILSHRTSQSVMLQQYSTPAPIGYLMGVFCGLPYLHEKGGYAYEPSAGNGLLTVAGKPERVYVNEIDAIRNRNLRTQGFANVFNRDATEPSSYIDLTGTFMAVLTNPPFGVLEKAVDYKGFPIRVLDHLMALRALEAMAIDGKAAIIIGGHTRWDELGRIQKGKNRLFFNCLYHFYNVVDVIQIDGHRLYTRQGTGVPVRLILIDGRKEKPQGAAPVFNRERDVVIRSFHALYERVMGEENNFKSEEKMIDINELEREAMNLEKLFSGDELGSPYIPSSNACVVLNTQVPDSMSFETQAALTRIKTEVGGSMDNFVRHRLGYGTHLDLCNALSAEQIDAVAMAIYNIEARGQGMIIGDQTGIGKGRIAAAMIRYGVKQGLKPIFITEKANLFSDIYRDLAAIGSAHLKPFIINGREPKTDIKDEDGNIIYQALGASEQSTIFDSKTIPAPYNFALGTYTQFNSPEKKPEKPAYLMEVAKDNLLIMDEAHNSSGSSNTGEFMQRVVRDTKGVVFLSATFAKRPDNMPIYAMKTSISEANMTRDELVEAIIKGGVALQEVLSSQLVAEGQMIRRERSFEGVEVNYISLDTYEEQHRKTADNITMILRDIIAFQKNHIDKQVEALDKIAVAEGKEVDLREGTSQAGVDNLPYFSKVFNVINQMLFSIKADAVAERAIDRLKEGKKPVIAFASTMGSFIEQMENDQGLPVSDGDTINTDFSEVLRRGLAGVMRYTEKDINGEPTYKVFEVSELSPEGQIEYYAIQDKINKVSTGITISPIDMVIQKLEKAGYTVAEVTGRKFAVQPNDRGDKGLVTARKRINTNDAFRMFNNNEVDVLMINQSGSTGASAHAIVTPKVPKEQVKQRVMIVLQAELDINTEVQKRGRINRTGQILKPIYDYMISAIPAEKRLMMMLQKKLKSLDANTTSNQKQSTKILDVPDFLNKYGDKVVKEYLLENKEVNELIGDPLHLKETSAEDKENLEDAAHKVSGRVAVLSTKMQADFYSEITERYNDYVEYLKQIGDYDLEVEALDLQTETKESNIIKVGKGGESAFGDDSILEKVEANILKKPFKKAEIENLLKEALGSKYAEEHKKELLDDFTNEMEKRIEEDIKESNDKYDELINEVPNEKKIQRILEKQGEGAYQRAVKEREAELNGARTLAIEQIHKSYKNKQTYLQRIFNFFTIGRKLDYPVLSYDNGREGVLAISLGVMIDKKKKNPYAPSVVKVRLAIANSNKYIAMPASNAEVLNGIMASSMNVETPELGDLLLEWEEEIKQKTKDRGLRYIITGNLLQAFGSESGKLVSYTTRIGETKKGILLPEEWRPKDAGQQRVTVPIIKALPLLYSMTNGSALYASNSIAFFKMVDDYRVLVPMARSKSGDIYIDKDLLALLNKGMFEKVSDKMQATLPGKNIEAFATILQNKYSVSVSVGLNQLSQIKPNTQRISTRKKIDLPPDIDETESERIRLLELEAEALELELQLLAA
ncbi:MAG: JAB domain-containing protein [Bacteroidia bacterium]